MPTPPLRVKPEISSFNLITVSFVINFPINGVYGEPIAMLVKHIVQGTKQTA